MPEMTSSAALAREFSEASAELAALTRRVQRERDAQPRIDASQWSGPASWACQLSLALLAREMDAAVELLRCASDLAGAAAWEARGNA